MALDQMRSARAVGVELCVMEAAVLFEAGWTDIADEIWTVFCKPAEAKRRLMERNKLSESEAIKRIDAQLLPEAKIVGAHVLICSDWTPAETHSQLDAAWAELGPRAAASDLFGPPSATNSANKAAAVDQGPDGLLSRWIRVTQLVDPSRQATAVHRKWWRTILQCYTEPQRFYHTFDHIEAMFEQYDLHHAQFDRPDLVAFAIFFHDLIYDPEAPHPDNEYKSAELFRKYGAQACLPPGDVDTVVCWIERTAKHMDGDAAGDLALFLDIDLEVLSRPLAEYAQYAEQIRLEYCKIPVDKFRIARAAAMAKFAERKSIYFSEPFKNRSAQAIANVRGEVARLRTFSSL